MDVSARLACDYQLAKIDESGTDVEKELLSRERSKHPDATPTDVLHVVEQNVCNPEPPPPTLLCRLRPRVANDATTPTDESGGDRKWRAAGKCP